jgi:TRAP-type C4-dicarboxylate transport system substrate-binding protein
MLKAIVYLAAAAWISSAHAQSVTLDLINEYPATSLPGEADAFFAAAVKTKTGGRVMINPVPDAKSGLRTRDQVKAVTEGKFAMADSFGGALGEDSPVFLLSSLPFVTPSMADARILFERAAAVREAVRRAPAEASLCRAVAAIGNLVRDTGHECRCAQIAENSYL